MVQGVLVDALHRCYEWALNDESGADVMQFFRKERGTWH
ncbi:hypothetical protein Dd703_0658 [Musicola paradisiaca Ech703]|uniref:Uncharacterized protein n=1 Tax=Musicola paradisiaca (strain Ech703) TaxID=579405 RepID=C6C9L8_MUSP7|nr:hypothetical protein Dd703_0658 [Musicola paradisiaca Ech703]